MFSRLFTLLPLAALVAVAAAAPNALGDRDNNCDTGSQYCCNTDQTTLTGLVPAGSVIGILQGTEANAGVTCSTLDIIAASGNSCSQQPVCCTANSFNGVVNYGCSPTNVNL